MKLSRREFVGTGLASVAGLCAGGLSISNAVAAESTVPPMEEDGYKLWLRYASPGDEIRNYRKTLRQIRVCGTSATTDVLR